MTVLAFLPVSLFLLALLYLDSFKLVRPRVLIELIVIGCLAAAAGLLINYWLLRLGVSRYMLTRYDAPAVEAAEIFPQSLWRHSYIRLSDAQFSAARELIEAVGLRA